MINAGPIQRYSTDSEQATLVLGAELAQGFKGGELVFLSGDLGVGKTTLVRGMLRGLGFNGRVKSPSYALLESYSAGGLNLHHLDLYRLGHAEEVHDLGLEELIGSDSVVLIEWPERGKPALPKPSTHIIIDAHGSHRTFEIQSGNSRSDR